MTFPYDTQVRTIDGTEQTLEPFRGKVLLIVNVASRCGFTPQYEGLEAMYQRLGARGLVVLGFPCDQFGHQEPGDEASIQSFCSTTYQVTFPLFGKIAVNGSGAHPLYRWLKREAKGLLGSEAIKWNFTKFLVDRTGHRVRRYGPRTLPRQIEGDVESLL